MLTDLVSGWGGGSSLVISLNKKILKILLEFENLKIQCKQQHELNKTLLFKTLLLLTGACYSKLVRSTRVN